MTTKFTKQIKSKGSNRIAINVDRNGVPFGQIWTYRNTAVENHPFHAMPLDGDHVTFPTLAQAKAHMEAS